MAGCDEGRGSPLFKVGGVRLPLVIESELGGRRRLVVDARELHRCLRVVTRFRTWFNRRVLQYGFVEGDQYRPILGEIDRGPEFRPELGEIGRGPEAGRPPLDYIVTVGMARHLASVERTKVGWAIREHLFRCEDELAVSDPQRSAELEGELREDIAAAQASTFGDRKPRSRDGGDRASVEGHAREVNALLRELLDETRRSSAVAIDALERLHRSERKRGDEYKRLVAQLLFGDGEVHASENLAAVKRSFSYSATRRAKAKPPVSGATSPVGPDDAVVVDFASRASFEPRTSSARSGPGRYGAKVTDVLARVPLVLAEHTGFGPAVPGTTTAGDAIVRLFARWGEDASVQVLSALKTNPDRLALTTVAVRSIADLSGSWGREWNEAWFRECVSRMPFSRMDASCLQSTGSSFFKRCRAVRGLVDQALEHAYHRRSMHV